ncbi:ribosomal protein L2, putative (apicoplast) [Theileria equi strain WA]|uniref:Ribosomal protein L2, putative n=1 Tax=Theileria equi strain WA TaxID=1537102 RepID=L1L9L9_THEEQ|nr:ribosomal protein L2, putative [Theileria equi strain WA]EKX71959.1 ribosomal protein L2, putative [Theileria equi strain WA]|eukprot:XP_025033552.1 ribosomal protein L2, putative (apicoplast) [Theileria equi strain WA]
MVIFRIYWKKKLGKNNTGHIITRHRKKGTSKFYIPTDVNYFNHFTGLDCYFMLYDVEFLYEYKSSAIIKCVNLHGGKKGEIRYILKPYTKTSKNFVMFFGASGKDYGDVNILQNYTIGDKIYNIEKKPTTKATMCLAVKSFSIIIKMSGNTSTIKLPSNSLKVLENACYVSYGFSDPLFGLSKTKAGDNKIIGRRPKVRGAAMNACDHSHGGGEGKTPIGKKFPHSFVGKKFKGIKTVKNKNDHNI